VMALAVMPFTLLTSFRVARRRHMRNVR
jgi:hypothetical protein